MALRAFHFLMQSSLFDLYNPFLMLSCQRNAIFSLFVRFNRKTDRVYVLAAYLSLSMVLKSFEEQLWFPKGIFTIFVCCIFLSVLLLRCKHEQILAYILHYPLAFPGQVKFSVVLIFGFSTGTVFISPLHGDCKQHRGVWCYFPFGEILRWLSMR